VKLKDKDTIPVNNQNVGVIKLPEENDVLEPGTKMVLTGWGDTRRNNKVSRK